VSGADNSTACTTNVDINDGFNKLFAAVTFDPSSPPSAAVKQQIKDAFNKNVSKSLADIAANPPAPIAAEIKDVVAKIQSTLGATGDPSSFMDPALQAKTHKIDLYFYDNCPGPRHAVGATEYSFSGLPAEVEAGVVNFKLTNTGKEEHELGLMTRKPGVTETFDQILALPEQQGRAKVDEVAQISAHPGENDATVARLSPGQYIAVCTVLQGSVGDKPGDGPPHFKLGMKREFTVR
ncbi:MAG: hypothetical protein ABR564_06635, partial [Candidatus Dormibacteria bacterium]